MRSTGEGSLESSPTFVTVCFNYALCRVTRVNIIQLLFQKEIEKKITWTGISCTCETNRFIHLQLNSNGFCTFITTWTQITEACVRRFYVPTQMRFREDRITWSKAMFWEKPRIFSRRSTRELFSPKLNFMEFHRATGGRLVSFGDNANAPGLWSDQNIFWLRGIPGMKLFALTFSQHMAPCFGLFSQSVSAFSIFFISF